MKVCVLHQTTANGGGTKSFLDIIQMLCSQYDVTAILPKFDAHLEGELRKKEVGIVYTQCDFPTFLYYSGGPSIVSFTFLKGLINFKYTKKIASLINSLNPDCVIFNTSVSIIIAKYLNSNIKKVCIIRETFKRGCLQFFFKKVLTAYFDGVCYIAPHEKSVLSLENPSIKEEIIEDVFCNVETNSFMHNNDKKKLNIPDEKFVILYMGGKAFLKGPDVILKALDVLGNDFFLIIAGDFNIDIFETKNILKRIYSPLYVLRQLRLKRAFKRIERRNNYIITGFLHDTSLLFQSCDVVVFPANMPHQPRPIIEAGYYNKCGILPANDEIGDYYIDMFNVLKFKPHDYYNLADKIKMLREDKILLKRLSDNNELATRTFHNYDIVKDKLLLFIKSII